MYARFKYYQPQSIDELLLLLSEKQPDTVLYGGGTDLLVDLRSGKKKASRIIDVKGIRSLHDITETPDSILIGAAATLTQIAGDPLVHKWALALAQGAGRVGSVQIRNKGTLAGNVQTASPAGDAFNGSYALGANAVLTSHRGTRRVSFQEYIYGPRRTAIEQDEFLEAVEIPKYPWTFQRFFKVGRRNALAISVVNGAVALDIRDGIIQDARVSVGAVAPTPIRIKQAEELLKGRELTEALTHEAGEAVKANVHPISDVRASADYRRYMAGTMVMRTLLSVLEDDQ